MSIRSASTQVQRYGIKYSNYIDFYERIALDLPDRPTVLEIGVANGGSLQMWRRAFGKDARIIGVDLNEKALTLQEEGFEILLLDTGKRKSWDSLKNALGPAGVDLLVDDGGHTNRQQISTLVYGLPLMSVGGWLVIEDLHASFMKSFGNPSKWSTWEVLVRFATQMQEIHPLCGSSAAANSLVAMASEIRLGVSIGAIRRGDGDQHLSGFPFGTDKSLMDYDHRWDSIALARLPFLNRSIVLRNLVSRLESWRVFRQVRKDLSGPT